MLKTQYDILVVGAGNGGLTAACATSQMGFRTLLIEKNYTPGGCAASFVRGRFEFEAALHNLPYMGEGEARGDIGMLFDRFGVKRRYYPIAEALHFIVDGPERWEFKAGVGREAFAHAAEEHCPGSRLPFLRFCELCDELDEALGYLSRLRRRPDFQEMPDCFLLGWCKLQELFTSFPNHGRRRSSPFASIPFGKGRFAQLFKNNLKNN